MTVIRVIGGAARRLWFWAAGLVALCGLCWTAQEPQLQAEKQPIRWVDFQVSHAALKQAMEYDIASRREAVQLDWVDLLAYAACGNGGRFKETRSRDIDRLAHRLRSGEPLEKAVQGRAHFAYYREAYKAALGGLLGAFRIEAPDPTKKGAKCVREKYGLKAFSPIAAGYAFEHYDDFGHARTFGFRRKHLGHDLLGSVGTPIIAVEDGVVENLGWNIYGGWRVGIRSLDRKRYYYYAHLRKGRPYQRGLARGKAVRAGDVIGYMGMTGYSAKEDTNNIDVPHLHFGLQLIFDESQDAPEIWIDVYPLVKLLQENRSAVAYDKAKKEHARVYHFIEE